VLGHKDASTVTSLLTLVRVRRATQLNEDIAADFDARELSVETPGIADLTEAAKAVAKRLSRIGQNRDDSGANDTRTSD
jgi:hypothetical protein